jgi:hypothetical protein
MTIMQKETLAILDCVIHLRITYQILVRRRTKYTDRNKAKQEMINLKNMRGNGKLITISFQGNRFFKHLYEDDLAMYLFLQ